MSNCKHCNKPIESHTGRRPKQYCDKNCRNAYFNAQKDKISTKVWKSTYDEVVAENKALKARIKELLSANPILDRQFEKLMEESLPVNFKCESQKIINDMTDFGSAAYKQGENGTTHIPLDSPELDELAIKLHNEEIQKKIAAIQKETIPFHRNTPLGKKVWEKEQEKKITELQSRLK